ncbi:unnamed protein product [Sympodiomycopsis kandeliae]
MSSTNTITGTHAATEAEDPSADLWSQILLSVQTAKSIPSCPIVVLGEPHHGKSTLLSHLSSQTDPEDSQEKKRSLAISYDYFDITSGEEDDIQARLSVHTLHSSHHQSLLQLHNRRNLSLDTLSRSLFVVVLDWTKPENFLIEIREWIAVVKELVQSAITAEKDQMAAKRKLQEMKEEIELFVKAYVSPGSATSAAAVNDDKDSATGEGSSIVALKGNPNLPMLSLSDEPLQEGVLDDNLGVNLVIVLTKSDTISNLERQRNFKEEQLDYIQQVLRTICLKYGASLFSTSINRPTSFHSLTSYLVHRSMKTQSSHTTTGSAFAFNESALTIEKDVLLVPSGWDSWGKIIALRDDFNPSVTNKSWEWDMYVEMQRRQHHKDKTWEQVEKMLLEQDSDREAGSACKLWEDVIGDEWIQTGKRDKHSKPDDPERNNSNKDRVVPPNAQTFLSQHYASLQKDNKQPQQPQPAKSGSIVGPMQSNSLSGPSVERLLSRDQTESQPLASPSELPSSSIDTPSTPTTSTRPPRTTRRESRGAAADTSTPSGTTSPGGSGSGSGAKQSQVLQDFFQELLKHKGSGPAPGSGSKSGSGNNRRAE